MSSFREFFIYKPTGTLREVDCLDDYFGKHQYGYRPLVYGHDEVMPEKEFYKLYSKQSGVPVTDEVRSEYPAESE